MNTLRRQVQRVLRDEHVYVEVLDSGVQLQFVLSSGGSIVTRGVALIRAPVAVVVPAVRCGGTRLTTREHPFIWTRRRGWGPSLQYRVCTIAPARLHMCVGRVHMVRGPRSPSTDNGRPRCGAHTPPGVCAACRSLTSDCVIIMYDTALKLRLPTGTCCKGDNNWQAAASGNCAPATVSVRDVTCARNGMHESTL